MFPSSMWNKFCCLEEAFTQNISLTHSEAGISALISLCGVTTRCHQNPFLTVACSYFLCIFFLTLKTFVAKAVVNPMCIPGFS